MALTKTTPIGAVPAHQAPPAPGGYGDVLALGKRELRLLVASLRDGAMAGFQLLRLPVLLGLMALRRVSR